MTSKRDMIERRRHRLTETDREKKGDEETEKTETRK